MLARRHPGRGNASILEASQHFEDLELAEISPAKFRKVVFAPSVDYNIAQNIYLAGGAYLGLGKRPEILPTMSPLAGTLFHSEFGAYPDCGNPRSGFVRIRCPDCHGEHLLTFSCKTRGFCPSCHAKRLEEWGEWVRESLLRLDDTRMDYLELIARVTSHIPDKGQVMVRYYGLYANAQIHPSLGVDVRGRKAAARLRLRDSRPGGGRGERGIRIAAGWEKGEPCPLWRRFRPTHRLSRPPGFETSTS
jgi:ribosomal protein S27E